MYYFFLNIIFFIIKNHLLNHQTILNGIEYNHKNNIIIKLEPIIYASMVKSTLFIFLIFSNKHYKTIPNNNLTYYKYEELSHIYKM